MGKHPSAAPGCDNCNETGVTRGYDGGTCPCLAYCPRCGELMPWDPNWEGRVPLSAECVGCAAEPQ